MSAKKSADWLIYQKLVAQIYSELDPNAIVTHDEKILGVQSNSMRQIDVTIRARVATTQLLIIVQVKDYKTPADINTVGEFDAVVKDVRANKGILVCSGGFSKNAHRYAESLGIALCRAADAESKKWHFDQTIPLVWIERSLEMNLQAAIEPVDRTDLEHDLRFTSDMQAWPIVGESRDFSNTTTLGACMRSLWSAGALPTQPDTWHDIPIQLPEPAITKSQDGTELYIREVRSKYRLTERAWLGQFTFSQLRALIDYNERTVHIKARVSRSELPLARSAKWEILNDHREYISKQPLSLTIEHELFDFVNVTNQRFSIEITN